MPELPAPGRPPRLSIITTVYDRAACLEFCLAAVSRLHVRDYEHLVVADHPPDDIAARLARLVQEQDDPRVTFHNLPRRADDFGITPAAHGLALARGDYVAFLDDDNAWLPQHFDALLDCLEREPGLGFVYSACLWNNEQILNHPQPALGHIDLGQVLFRRGLFRTLLDDRLAYCGYEWDWQLISDLLRRGVACRYFDQETFIFRVQRYPQYPPPTPLDRAHAAVDALAAQGRDLQQQLAAAAAERDDTRRTADALAAQGRDLQQRLAAAAADLAARERLLAEQHARAAALTAACAAARAEVELVRQSTSWRATAPLRAVTRRLRRLFRR